MTYCVDPCTRLCLAFGTNELLVNYLSGDILHMLTIYICVSRGLVKICDLVGVILKM